MYPKRLLVRALALGMLGLGAAQAGDFFVQQSGGNDANPGTAWGTGNAVATIKRGLDLAVANAGPDTVHVAAGTYAENLVLYYSGSDTTLLGSYPATGAGPRNRATTPSVIDGSGTGIVFSMAGVSNIVLDRFVIQNGSAASGGGVYFGYDASNVTLSYNLIQNNVAQGLGGGVAAGGGGPSISGLKLLNNVIRNNQAQTGGGIYLGGGTTAQVLNNVIRDNRVLAGDGGGMALRQATTRAVLRGNSFIKNTASAWGGGIFNEESRLTLIDNLIQENSARDGGGIAIHQTANLTADHNDIVKNQASYDGGGILHWGSRGSLSRNTVQGNHAVNWGGGICILSDSHPTLTNNLITRNVADNTGGGFSLWDRSSAVVTNLTLYHNQARAGNGGGIMVSSGTQLTLKNGILWGNLVGLASPVKQQIHADNVDGASVTYSDIEGGGWAGAGNIDVTPQFQRAGYAPRPLQEDFHLMAASPARDTGSNAGAPNKDLDGNPRPYNTLTDMGAYEWSPAPDLTGAWRSLSMNEFTIQGIFRVRNAVADQSAKNFRVSFYRSNDGKRAVGLPFNTQIVNGLAGGAIQDLAINHTFVTTPSQYVLAMVDSQFQVRELSERNNLKGRLAAPAP